MSEISNDHVEWAVVDRLGQMLDGAPHVAFNVTQTYALFTAVLCWVMQRVRTPESRIQTEDDEIAVVLGTKLSEQRLGEDPWTFAAPVGRALVGGHTIPRLVPESLENHSVLRFVVNLRDAVAHGDARTVQPFHLRGTAGEQHLLAGFTFICRERDRADRRRIGWRGEVTLLESDMRRIGTNLAKSYCEAMRSSKVQRGDSQFSDDAERLVRDLAV
jgi:hypothetical protein